MSTMKVDLSICGSILAVLINGLPWNHLCTKGPEHDGDHVCWHGRRCAHWTDAEERKPREPYMVVKRTDGWRGPTGNILLGGKK